MQRGDVRDIVGLDVPAEVPEDPELVLDNYGALDVSTAVERILTSCANGCGTRLLQEARLASSIGHENIVDVTDFGTTDDGRSFVVMEFLDGESLAELERREAPLPIERSLRIARQAASALGAAHAKGIFHRDVKPENLYLIRRGEADFVKVGPTLEGLLTSVSVTRGAKVPAGARLFDQDDIADRAANVFSLKSGSRTRIRRAISRAASMSP